MSLNIEKMEKDAQLKSLEASLAGMELKKAKMLFNIEEIEETIKGQKDKIKELKEELKTL